LQKFTNFHAIRLWNFQNICNEIGWPRFLRHPVQSAEFVAAIFGFLFIKLQVLLTPWDNQIESMTLSFRL